MPRPTDAAGNTTRPTSADAHNRLAWQIITGAVDSAIGDAFSNGGNPIAVGPNGVRFNFAEEPASDPRMERAYAGLGALAKPADPAGRVSPDREWSAWLDLRGTGWTQNDAASLSFTISNPNASSLTGVGFTDTLPSGLVVATPNGLDETCGGTIQATSGSSSISIANATLLANSSCSVTIKVVGTSIGTKNNPVTQRKWLRCHE
jgi:hypothetical protein